MLERIFSWFATLATVIICCIWWCKYSVQWHEPAIGLITSSVALLFQSIGLYSRLHQRRTILEAPWMNGYQNTTVLPGVIDFVLDSYQFTVKPIEAVDQYWRAGFKMSEVKNIALDHLEQATALVTVEQTGQRLTFSLHINGARVGRELEIVTDYRGEKVMITYQEKGTHFHFSVKLGKRAVHSQEVPAHYRFGRLLAFGDGHAYKLQITEKNLAS
ncbi:hypothetical protein J2T02_002637 [Chitinophaga terrae (ex Kim and Jung 2007)]|uniref:hypothetical protein n=1 Tax=Chitinophaga terrae (ex Kim and Jung 2007) TaxID=408074 RepID=UPI00278006A4|nr:hypothetical protein [Chitinophaga terrae (ex Kim and Jung 2007)]MDQ0107518.1 hypothetical protein [Chitinophaga terrae (ex Kim and Jung 2007)]